MTKMFSLSSTLVAGRESGIRMGKETTSGKSKEYINK